MCAWPWVDPRRRVQAGADRNGHQRWPRRVEVHLVDAVAVAIERPQLGWELVRQSTPLLRLGRAGATSESDQVVDRPLRVVALDPFHQCRVTAEQVIAG